MDIQKISTLSSNLATQTFLLYEGTRKLAPILAWGERFKTNEFALSLADVVQELQGSVADLVSELELALGINPVESALTIEAKRNLSYAVYSLKRYASAVKPVTDNADATVVA